MTGLIIHPSVAPEVAAAAAWYRRIDPELAERFLHEVYESIRKAREMPLLSVSSRILTAESSRIVFEIMGELQLVHIVSVIHQMRRPDRWKQGLD